MIYDFHKVRKIKRISREENNKEEINEIESKVQKRESMKTVVDSLKGL